MDIIMPRQAAAPAGLLFDIVNMERGRMADSLPSGNGGSNARKKQEKTGE
jgi:hypothetical protein